MQLTSLLEEAQGATPDRRILFRDQIAPFGTRAIEGVEPWLTSDVLAAFAVRVILRVGQQGERIAAAKALRAARRRVPPRVLGDVEWALASLRLAAKEAEISGRHQELERQLRQDLNLTKIEYAAQLDERTRKLAEERETMRRSRNSRISMPPECAVVTASLYAG